MGANTQDLMDQEFKDLQERLNGPLNDQDREIIKGWMSTKEIKDPIRLMVPLTPEQKEYISLKKALDRMTSNLQDWQREGNNVCLIFRKPSETYNAESVFRYLMDAVGIDKEGNPFFK